MINIKKDKKGWDEVNKQLDALRKKGKLTALTVLKQIGLKGEQIIVNHLADQDLNWAPLSENYKKAKERRFKRTANAVAAKRKRMKGEKPAPTQKTLIDTSTLFQSITSFAKEGKVAVGVPAGNKYTTSGKSVAYVAAVHEYGSAIRNIPARPLFKPSRDELKEWCSNNWRLANSFISEIKSNV